jgi:ribosome-associated heat shock protein Hsp15
MANGGHVQPGGERIKPSKSAEICGGLRIQRGQELFPVTVLAEKLGSAAIAQTLYQEAKQGMATRDEQGQLLNTTPALDKQPDKKTRIILSNLSNEIHEPVFICRFQKTCPELP